MNATNYGRQINLVSGINGVVAGGQAVLQVPVNRRFHRILLMCMAIALAGGNGLTCTAVTSANGGTGLKADVTTTNGAVNTAVVHSGSAGTNWSVGDTFVWADPNYPTASGYTNPVLCTVATVSSGAVATFTTAATAVATQPGLVISGIQLKVNGVIMRDVSVAQTLAIIAANPFNKAYSLGAGQLPLLFTEPWRNLLKRNTVTSWDVFGQPNFEIDINVQSGITAPNVTGTWEFDYQRNQYTPKGQTAPTPFLQPVKYKSYSTGVIASGMYNYTTLPINYPISRIWMSGSTPGNITRVTINQDGNIVSDGFTPSILEDYGEYGFNITGAGFDTAFISDPDQRIGKCLKVQSSLILSIYTAVQQNVTLLVESLPGNYA
jgi:hypothetical protein